jgi:hypothetical protein
LQAVTFLFTPLEGLLAFLHQSFSPLKIKTKEKTFQNHYHGEKENPNNFHQKLLSTNLRWGELL